MKQFCRLTLVFFLTLGLFVTAPLCADLEEPQQSSDEQKSSCSCEHQMPSEKLPSHIHMPQEEDEQLPLFDDSAVHMFFSMLQQAQELINDPADKQFLQGLMESVDTFDEQKDSARLDRILKRAELIYALQERKKYIKDSDALAKVVFWLDNQQDLDKETVREEAYKILMQAGKEEIADEKEKKQRREKIKNSFIAGYTCYRKFMFLRMLDTGEGAGWIQKMINWLASGLYTGGLFLDSVLNMLSVQMLMEKYQQQGDAQGLQECQREMMSFQRDFEYNLNLAREIRKDDFAEYIDKRLELRTFGYNREQMKKFFKKGIAQNGSELPSLYERECKRIAQKVQGRKGECPCLACQNQQIPDNDKIQQLSSAIHHAHEQDPARGGCAGVTLDFYDVFDAYLDRKLESKIGNLLTKINVPKMLQTLLWKNGGMRFLREVMLFKMFPTYIYWQVKTWWNNEDGKFSSYIPLREAVKSAGHLAEHKLVNFLVNHANGKWDRNGRGRLDKAKNYTCGIVGPNLFDLAGKLCIPPAMVAISDKVKPGFLLGEDYLLDPHTERRVSKEVGRYLGKSVVSFLIIKLLGAYKHGIFRWCGRRINGILGFMQRRGWISEDTIDKLAIWGEAFKHMTPLLYAFFLGNDKILSRFDFQDAARESYITGDEFKFFDYMIANWIGEKVGHAFVGFLQDELIIPAG